MARKQYMATVPERIEILNGIIVNTFIIINLDGVWCATHSSISSVICSNSKSYFFSHQTKVEAIWYKLYKQFLKI